MKKNIPLTAISLLIVRCVLAGADSFSTTNVGGWDITLAAPTNRFPSGTNVLVTLTVSNTTPKAGDIGNYSIIAGATTVLPRFGELTVGHHLDGTNVIKRFHFVAPSIPKLSIPMVTGKELNGQVGPSGCVSFPLDLTVNWDVKAMGKYELRFVGELPSLLPSDQRIKFELQPLIITVAPPAKSQANDDILSQDQSP